MPSRSWTDADNVKLRGLAGKIPAQEIAAQLGRSMGATAVHASKLKLSLSMRRQDRKPAEFAAVASRTQLVEKSR